MKSLTVRVGSGTSLALVRDWARRVAAHLVQNVPEDLSFCEYECHDPRCNMAKLAVCVKHPSHRDTRS